MAPNWRIIIKIDKTIELPDGAVQFQGNLSSKELDFILEVGLGVLLTQGAIPFLTAERDTPSIITTSVETVQ